MTVHIIFIGGPMDGTIHSMEDPGDEIEFPTDRGDKYIEYAVYRKLRIEDGPDGSVFRGKQGVYIYARIRIEEVDE